MSQIPEDFPRDPFPALLGGSQPKLAGRLINGRLVVGLTEEERAERYAMCVDLVHQIVAYCHRKQRQSFPLTAEILLVRVGNGIKAKQQLWGLADAEVVWIIQQVKLLYETRR